MKVLSFALWGDQEKYTYNAIENVVLAEQIYPGWIIRFYVDKQVPEVILSKLRILGCDIVKFNVVGNHLSMFWRFFPVFDDSTHLFISRDCDSLISHRESLMVREWVNSSQSIHIIRDHPYHSFPVMGGMWGAKKNSFHFIGKHLLQFNFKNKYGNDQDFLAQIYAYLSLNSLTHDSIYSFETPKYGPPSPNNYIGRYAYNNSISCNSDDSALIKFNDRSQISIFKSRLSTQVRFLMIFLKSLLYIGKL